MLMKKLIPGVVIPGMSFGLKVPGSTALATLN